MKETYERDFTTTSWFDAEMDVAGWLDIDFITGGIQAVTGAITQTLLSITQAANANFGPSATITQTLLSITQAANASFGPNATITMTLGTITQSATGFTDVTITSQMTLLQIIMKAIATFLGINTDDGSNWWYWGWK